jgi:hypothetical protein
VRGARSQLHSVSPRPGPDADTDADTNADADADTNADADADAGMERPAIGGPTVQYSIAIA